MAETEIEKIKDKLNDMFDVEGGVITKTQYCPTGRWAFTLGMALFFAAIYAFMIVCLDRLYGSLYWFMFLLLSVVLLYFEARLWLAFALDFKGQKFAERTLFWKKGDSRLYYSRGKHVSKLEYESGGIEAGKDNYDKFEDKANYSPFAGRYNKSLQRRSSLYSTMTPSFWFGILCDMNCSLSENGIKGEGRGGRVEFICGKAGKISEIRCEGNGYYLYDSLSPIKIFNAKIPGKYRITYKFEIGDAETICADEIFGNAIKDFLWAPPRAEAVKFVSPVPFSEWLKDTDEKIAKLRASEKNKEEIAAASSAIETENIIEKEEFSTALRKSEADPKLFEKTNLYKHSDKICVEKSRMGAGGTAGVAAEENPREYSPFEVAKQNSAEMPKENENKLLDKREEEKFTAGKTEKHDGKR